MEILLTLDRVLVSEVTDPVSKRGGSAVPADIRVAVYQGDQFIRWANDRPVRKLPTGFVCVVFRRSAYPVYRTRFESLSIDVEDKPHDTTACGFWPDTEPLAYSDSEESRVSKWHLESNFYGHYLVFDGDDRSREDVLARLAKHKVGVRRHGPSIRPADDHYHYDWFVRLDLDDDRENVLATIQTILADDVSRPNSAVTPTSAILMSLPSHLSELALAEGYTGEDAPALVEWLGDLLDASFENADEERGQLQSEVDQKEASLAEVIDLTNKSRIEMTGVLKREEVRANVAEAESRALIDRLDDSSVATASTIALEQENAVLRQDLDTHVELLEEAARQEADRAKLKRELDEAREESRVNGLKLEKSERHSSPRIRLKERHIRMADRCLAGYDRLEFVADAAEELLAGFTDDTQLFRMLEQLQNREDVSAKRIAAADGWREVNQHINTGNSTGSADMGRVYFRKIENDRLSVVIHCKKDDREQSRLFEKLGNPKYSGGGAF
jgi:hypothetical protein